VYSKRHIKRPVGVYLRNAGILSVLVQYGVSWCLWHSELTKSEVSSPTDVRVQSENAGVQNAGVENTGAETYGKPSIQKFLTDEARIRMCLIANGRQSPISGKPNRTGWPGS